MEGRIAGTPICQCVRLLLCPADRRSSEIIRAGGVSGKDGITKMMKYRETVEPEVLSFRQLREMVGSSLGRRLPKPGELCNGEGNILFQREYEDFSLTVYSNGLFLYQYGGLAVVSAVDRCREVRCRYEDETSRVFHTREFESGPCLVPLILAGDALMAARFDMEMPALLLSGYVEDLEDTFRWYQDCSSHRRWA